MRVKPIRLSTTTKQVLDALLEAHGSEYGLGLCRSTGLASGTVHPILARLEAAGWVTSEWEAIDPHAAGRPQRRYYRLTAEGAASAQAVLASSPAPRLSPRLRPRINPAET